MTKPAHTPGPWISCSNHVDDSEGVALFRSTRSFHLLNPADFHLAAAAPRLYEVCRMLVEFDEKELESVDDLMGELHKCITAAREAVHQYESHLSPLQEKNDE